MSTATPLLDVVREFAFPRAPGGPAERRAAEEMARRLGAVGLEVEVEPFEACRVVVSRMRRRLHFAAAASVLVQGIVGTVAPAGAAVIGGAILAFFGWAGRWSTRIETEYDGEPGIESRNVVGRRRAPAAADAPAAPAAPITLVVLAHLDSKSARYPTAVPVLLVLLAMALVAGMVVAGVVLALRPGAPGGGPAWAALGAIAAIALVVAQHNPSGDESPGAMDNASGLAILLAAAERLPRDPALAAIDLVFLATGAEEIGLAGAVRWIARHESELDRRRTVFLNVDSVGVGRGLLGLNVQGSAPDGRPMRDVIRAAAKAAGVRLRTLPFLPGVGVDSMPMAGRGYATVTLLGEVLGGGGRRIHTARDTLEHLDEPALAAAASLVSGIAREIDREIDRGGS